MASARTGVAFLDLEATGFGPGSWPIEIALALDTGRVWSSLIRPAPDWSWDVWQPASARIHKIPRAMIEAEGRAPEEVYAQFMELLGGRMLISDAPTIDRYWFSRLAQASGSDAPVPPMFAFSALTGGTNSRGRWKAAKDAAWKLAPKTHRAAPDARWLFEVWNQLGRPGP